MRFRCSNLARAAASAVFVMLVSTLLAGSVSAAGSARQPSGVATRLATLSPAQCRSELARRKLAVQRTSKGYAGVATALRISGPLRGVRFKAPGKRSVYGVLDCRLALALDELAALLADAGVTEVHVDNFYRPHAHLPGRRDKPSQHSYGLAADIDGFTLQDGRRLIVERDWSPKLGEPPCDEGVQDGTAEPALLRKLVCDVLARGLFHHVLTPNTNAAHRSHLHFDIARSTPHRARSAPRKRAGKRAGKR